MDRSAQTYAKPCARRFEGWPSSISAVELGFLVSPESGIFARGLLLHVQLGTAL